MDQIFSLAPSSSPPMEPVVSRAKTTSMVGRSGSFTGSATGAGAGTDGRAGGWGFEMGLGPGSAEATGVVAPPGRTTIAAAASRAAEMRMMRVLLKAIGRLLGAGGAMNGRVREGIYLPRKSRQVWAYR